MLRRKNEELELLIAHGRKKAESQLSELTATSQRYKEKFDGLTTRMEQTRDRILAGLDVGKQSPKYKQVKAALDELINKLEEP